MAKKVIPLILLLAFTAVAKDPEVLSIDRRLPDGQLLVFPNDKNIKPMKSSFNIINYVPLSNELGERWAVITLNNTATGNRVLEPNHLQALLANGQRKKPGDFKIHFERQESQTITVSFGKSKFPILSIMTNN